MHLVKDSTGKPASNLQSPICSQRRRCPACRKQNVGLDQITRHRCYHIDCPSCHEYVDGETHRCFIQIAPKPQANKKKRKRATNTVPEDQPPLHVFFDIEAMQPQERHIANLVVAETEDDDPPKCFPGEHCVRDFLEWLDTLTLHDTRQVNVLAHNFQGYDGYFVIHQYYGDNRIVEQLRNGCKLLQVQHDRIRFIDSMSFFQMPLSAFPKTFGLTDACKGYFPHKFNHPDHQTYVGPVPALDYYMPETLSPEGRQALETWHQEQRAKNVVFDFQKELLAYCQSDVRLLKQGCLTFKRLFETLTGFNPFEHITIASACNRDLRMNRMIPNSIASEPVRGWRNSINQSRVAIEWLTWCAQENNIQHVGNAGEVRIPPLGFIDGYCHDTRTVYEFQGCFTHGCPTCYPNRHEPHVRHFDRTLQDVYEASQQKIQRLKELGYTVVQMWECEWARLKDTSSDIRTFVDQLQFTDPLNPRDAFCGGRTNAVKLYHRVTPTQKIHYIDVTSLYPWVNKTCLYPKGHPTFISTPGHTDIRQYFGLIQCQILPPRELYHPVLPYRHEGKLLFPLCASCVKEEMVKPLLGRTAKCHHTDDQRVLTGTWCSPELAKAVELGYQVQYIYEVWHFDETCEGLFEDYVNTWLKIKQEASGWPAGVDTEDQKQAYIKNYFEHEGIQLEYDKIAVNKGLRTLAKMMLNSMWGKFGQRLNKTQVQTFHNPHAFHRFLDTSTLDVRHVSVINDDLVEVHYQYQDEDIPVSPNLNIFVACFTTCWARLRLYTALEKLGERVLYYDTDSIIFLQDEGQVNPTLGEYLGDFTSELDPDDYITEFVSAGPKNYGYQTKLGHVECKVRGFRLNSEGKSQLNYNIMRLNVLEEIQKPLGPWLFILMIDDIDTSNAELWKYVDDTTIAECVDKNKNSTIQSDVEELIAKSNCNKFQLNEAKCKELRISFARSTVDFAPIVINGKAIELVPTVKLLGLNISCDLRWNCHVEEISKKVSSRLYFLKQLKRANVPQKDLLTFYVTCIRPVTEYACPVFHNALPAYLSAELEQLQKRAMRIIFPFTSYRDALQQARLETLSARRELITSKLFESISSNENHRLYKLLPSRNKCHFNLRHKRNFNIPMAKTKRLMNTFIYSNCN